MKVFKTVALMWQIILGDLMLNLNWLALGFGYLVISIIKVLYDVSIFSCLLKEIFTKNSDSSI